MNLINRHYYNTLNEVFDVDKGIISFKHLYTRPNLNDHQITEYEFAADFLKKNYINITNKEDIMLVQYYLDWCKYNNISNYYKMKDIYAFYLGKSIDPLQDLFYLFYSQLSSLELIDTANICSKYILANALHKTRNNFYPNAIIFHLDLNNEYWETVDQVLLGKLKMIIPKTGVTTVPDTHKFLKEFCKIFKEYNYTFEDIGNSFEEFDETEETENEVLNIDRIKYTEEQYYEQEINIDELLKNSKLSEILFPEFSLTASLYEKYSKYLTRQNNNIDACGILKTVLYISTYLKRNHSNSQPYINMKKITNAKVNWATGTAKTTDASFYGNSKIGKAFSAYYSFMTAKKNPYNDIINNRVYDHMQKEALKMHKYFKEEDYKDYFYKLFYEKKLVGNLSVVDLLSQIYVVLDELEKPIVVNPSGLLIMIKGLVSSMLNTVSKILDMTLSLTLRQLFYLKIVPINKEKYSLADIYNYLTFLRIILEHADDEKMVLDNLTKEEVVNLSYQALGIRRTSIEKTGWCAYDLNLNDKSGLNIYGDKLAKNINGSQFALKDNSKLFYSLIQFAILKNCYMTGNNQYYYDFDYGNLNRIKNLIYTLDMNEVLYVFELYNIDLETFNKTKFTKETVSKYNDDILNIFSEINMKDISLYQNYKDENKLYSPKEYKLTNLEEYLNACYLEYKSKMAFNREAINEIVFENNNITNVDDFIVRFLPSIRELMRIFGYKTLALDMVIEFIDYICYFIADVLFRNIFINLKKQIADKIKSYEENLFSDLDEDVKLEGTVFQLDFGGTVFKNKIKEMLNVIENLSAYEDLTNECFYHVDDADIAGGDDIYFENIDLTNDDPIHIKWIKDDEIEKEKWYNKREYKEDTRVYYHERNDKEIIYKNKEIIIKDKDGNENVVVNVDDDLTIDVTTTTILPPKDVEIHKHKNPEFEIKRNKPNEGIHTNRTEKEILIKIRDHIRNISDKKIIELINKINEVDKHIQTEIHKKLPNNIILSKLKEERVKLTNELQYVKNKQNGYVSESKQEIDDFSDFEPAQNNEGLEQSETIPILLDYSNIEDLVKKEEILKELENVVYTNNLFLTNYEITEFLK